MTQQKKHHGYWDVTPAFTGSLQIFELKQLADMEAVYKRRALATLQAYKNWQRRHGQETDMIEILYGNLEGIMLRRHAENCVRIYWTVRRDFRKGFQDYLIRNKCYPTSGAASAHSQRTSA